MILSVTPNPALDHTLRLDEPLAAGAVARTDETQFDPGGKGINVSKYLASLDAPTVATGFLGDPFGRLVRDRLREAGIESDFVTIDEPTRLNTTVLAPDGEYKINHDGPRVGPAAVDRVLDAIRRRDPETVVVAGSLPPGVGPDAVDRIARAGDWETAADVGGGVLRDLEAPFSLCKPNREELAAATDAPVGTVEECLAAAEALRGAGFDRVVASLGPDGAVLATGDGTYHAPAVETTVVDTVGAGDALLAGVLAALARDESGDAALRAGVAVASRVVAVAGTRVPDFDGVLTAADDVPISAY
ncbi:1-phosphofructokinase [Halomarina halobia]|uniref:1-phosphofructokinase n=1 Tax=Halomarina halobia TaxID=3033386 RepID=A0ABD6ABL7_9EURY|nr:1-phosphofructokinase [Halomarina sp. PSR21]